MKRTALFSVALLALLFGLLGTYQPSPANGLAAASPPLPNVQTVPLFRLFSPKTGMHFYTIDVNRKLEAMGSGWTFEGIATHVLDRQGPDTVPLYVLVVGLLFTHPDGSSLPGHCFRYTTNEQEKNQLLQTAPVSRFLGGDESQPWKLDRNGIAAYVAPAKQFGTVPLYRLYHPERLMEETHGARACAFNSYDTLYTTSEQEMTDAINNHGYKFVRIEGFVWPQPTSVGPHISAGQATPNADKDLLNRGCTREGVGIYNCPTITTYEMCQVYRDSGRVKRCHTSADTDKQAAMDKDLFNQGCKRLLGRPDEFLCQTQKGLIACERYHKEGRVKPCKLAN